MATVPWDQTPGYLAASNTTIVPGDPTEYAVRRRGGNSRTDVTSFHPGQANWDKSNPPEIFFQLRPSQAWVTFAKSPRPRQKLDGAGLPMVEREPLPGKPARPILDFAVLPDKIGTKEDMFFIELWRRMDGRIRWEDILMRMELRNRPKANALNMRASRKWRPACGLIAWHCRGITFSRGNRRNGVLNQLTQAQIAANTTRGISPGLLDLTLGEVGGRIPWPDETDEETEDDETEDDASNDNTCDKGRKVESHREDENEEESEDGGDEGSGEDETDEEEGDDVGGQEIEDGNMEEDETVSEEPKTKSNDDTEPGDSEDDSVSGTEDSIQEQGSTSDHSESASNSQDQGSDLVDDTADEYFDLPDANSRPSTPAQTDTGVDVCGVAHNIQPSANNLSFRQLPVSGRYDDPLYKNYPYGTTDVAWHITPLLRGPPSKPSRTISIQDYADMDQSLLAQPSLPAPSGEGPASSLGKRKR